MEQNKIEFLFPVFKGGDENKFLSDLNNIISNQKDIKDIKNKFLKNFIALTLKELNLDRVFMFLDYSLGYKEYNKDETTYALAESSDRGISLSEDLFKNNKNIIEDLEVLSHELMHQKIMFENFNFIKFIGKNSNKFIYSFYDDQVNNFTFLTKAEFYALYLNNENESLANDFAFNYINSFYSKLTNMSEATDKKIIAELFKKQELNNTCYKELKEKFKNKEYISAINKIKNYQLNLFKEISIKLKLNYNITKKTEIQNLIDKMYLLIDSFSYFYNDELINDFKSYLINEDINLTLKTIFFEILLNTKNYIITKEDLKILTKMYEYNNMDFQFNCLYIDKKNLIENYIDLKYSSFKEFKNFLLYIYKDLNKIENATQIEQLKNNFSNENDNTK